MATKHVFCRDKNILAAINLLLQQNYVSRDKHTFVVTNDVYYRICSFVASNTERLRKHSSHNKEREFICAQKTSHTNTITKN